MAKQKNKNNTCHLGLWSLHVIIQSYSLAAFNIRAAPTLVTNVNDSGAGSLRTSLTNATPNTAIDTIPFDTLFNSPQSISILSNYPSVAKATPGSLAVSPTGTLTLNGGTFNIFTFSGTGGVFNLSNMILNGTSVNNTSVGTGSQINADNMTFARISGAGTFQKTGTGTVIFNGANTYTGATTITNGTLSANLASALSSSSAVTISAGASLTLNNFNQTIPALTGAATSTITLGSGTLTINGATNTTFSGIISGTGGFSKAGNSNLTLGAVQTYTGTTALSAGTLTMGIPNALQNSSTVNLTGGTFALNNFSQTIQRLTSSRPITLGNANLTLNNTLASSSTGVISGTGGSLTKNGIGTFNITGGNNTFTGGTTINNGIISVNASARLGTGGLTLNSGILQTITASQTYGAAFPLNVNVSGGTLDVASGLTTTFNGNFASNGLLTKSSAGTLSLLGTITGTSGFNVTGGTLSGTTTSLQGNAALAAGTTLSFNQATNGTYTGNISGAGNLTKLGTGIVTLSGTHTHTGTTTISAGTLQAGANNTLSPNSNLSIAGTLALNNFNQTVPSIAGAGAITLGSGTLTLNGTTSTTHSGVISGTGNLIKQNTSTLTLTGTNTYTGNLTLQGGTLSIASNNPVQAVSSIIFNAGTLQTTANITSTRPINFLGNGILNINSGTTLTANGVLSGAGLLTKNGLGTLILGANNTNTGNIDLSSGTLSGTTASIQGNIATAAGTTLTFNQATNGTYTGNISGAGNLTKLGTGIVTLSGTHTHTGTTTISVGTLQAGANNTLSPNSNLSIAGTLALNNFNQTVPSITGAGAITLGSGTLTLDGTTSTTHSGVISGTGNLIKQNTSTLTLTGTNTYTGNLTLQGGTLSIASNNPVQAVSSIIFNAGTLQTTANITSTRPINFLGNGILNINSGTTLTANGVLSGAGLLTKNGLGTLTLGANNTHTGNIDLSSGTLSGTTASIQGNVATAAGTTLSFNQATNGTYTGNISGAGNLTKLGTGIVTLSGTHTHTGTTTISAGNLAIASQSNIGTGTLNLAGGRLQTTASLALNNILSLGIGTNTILTDPATTATLSGPINGTGTLAKQGTGTLILSGLKANASTFSLNAGILQGDTNSLNGDVSSAPATTLIFNQNTPGTYPHVISGPTHLTKMGTDTLTLSAAHSYTGTTTLSAGTLSLGVIDAIASSAALNISAGTTLNLNTFNQTILGLNHAGTINLGTAALTLNTATSSGDILGTGTLIKSGIGTLTLSAGNNIFSGGTTIHNGIISVNAPERLGTGGLTLNGGTLQTTTANQSYGLAFPLTINPTGGTLDVASGLTTTLNGSLSLAGILTKSSIGILSLQGTTTGAGSFNLTGGTLSGTTASIQGNVATAAGTTLTFNQATNGTYTGNISGAGNLTKLGTGIVTLSGTHTHTGTTTISAGTLAMAAQTHLGTGTLNLAGGTLQTTASLALNNILSLGIGTNTILTDPATTATLSGPINGTGTLAKQGTGTLILSGLKANASTFSLNAGILQGDTNSLNGDVSSAPATTLIFNQNTPGTYPHIISGPTHLTKMGTDTLTLSAAHSYTGTTTLSAGTLSLGVIDAIASSAALNISAGATFNLNTFNQTIGGISGTGSILLGSATLTVHTPILNTFNGQISGSGGLTKTGSNTLLLSNANTFSGPTHINDGTLALGALNSISSLSPIHVSALATFNLNGFNHTTSSLSGSGTLTLGSGNLTLNLSSNPTFNGVISGTGGLTVSGHGALNLTGNHIFNGPTLLNGPSLIVNGSMNSPVTVSSSSHLSGQGQLNSTVTNSGNVTPGIGGFEPITINHYIQQNGGQLNIKLSPTQNSSVQATQATIQNGSILSLTPSTGPYAVGNTFTVLNTTGGITGQFISPPTFTNTILSKFKIKEIYTTNTYQIELASKSLLPLAQSNNNAVIQYLNSLPDSSLSGDLQNILEALGELPEDQLEKAVDTMDNEESTANHVVTETISSSVTTLLSSRLSSLNAPRTRPASRTFSFASPMPVVFSDHHLALSSGLNITQSGMAARSQDTLLPLTPFSSQGGIWVNFFGHITRSKTINEDIGFHSKTGGVILGADHRVGRKGHLGVTFGHTLTKMEFDNNQAIGKIKSFFTGLYGGWSEGNQGFSIKGSLVGSLIRFNKERYIRIPVLGGQDITRTANSNNTGISISPSLNLSYRRRVSYFTLEPYLGINFIYTKERGYGETGAGSLNLQVAPHTTKMIRAEMGSEVTYFYKINPNTELHPLLKLSIIHKKNLGQRIIVAHFSGQPNQFMVEGYSAPQTYLAPGIGIKFQNKNQYYLQIRYDGEFNKKSQAHEINFLLGVKF